MNKNKIDINSTEPINSIAEVDRVVDAFVKTNKSIETVGTSIVLNKVFKVTIIAIYNVILLIDKCV